MLATGTTIFARFPGESKRRVLYPCKVTETATGGRITVLPEDEGLGFEAEQEILIYFEKRRQFMQQAARVDALLDTDEGQVVAFQALGEPVSAESRQCYRVSTVLSDIKAIFDDVYDCPLRDVSVTGFAVASPNAYKIGQVLDAEIVFEGKRYVGEVSIQSVAPLRDGMTRYGVNCIKSTTNPKQCLLKGVQHISMSVQRQQLSRLAGGA